MPALICAWRAGAWPCPPCTTWPISTSSTSLPPTRARLMASLIAIAPRSEARSAERPPRNLPIGVRAAPTMNTSGYAVMGVLLRWQRQNVREAWFGAAYNERWARASERVPCAEHHRGGRCHGHVRSHAFPDRRRPARPPARAPGRRRRRARAAGAQRRGRDHRPARERRSLAAHARPPVFPTGERVEPCAPDPLRRLVPGSRAADPGPGLGR